MQGGIHAVLLAGVHQWRPSVFERWVPRTLVPILNRPLVDYPLSWLRHHAVDTVCICANSDTHALQSRQTPDADSELNISFYEDVMPRGPAGCLADAAGERDCDTIVVVDATLLPDAIDLAAAIETHRAADAAMTVVASVSSRPPSGRQSLSPVGVFVISKRVLHQIPSTGYQDIKEMLIPRLHGAGARVVVHRIDSPAIRVTGAASCFTATDWALARRRRDAVLPAGMQRLGTAFIHETARVADSVRFIGPVWIGAGVEVGEHATIIGPTSIGAGTLVEVGGNVCRSILWDGVRVGKDAVMDRCIVTSGAEVGAGTRVSHRIHHRATGIRNRTRQS